MKNQHIKFTPCKVEEVRLEDDCVVVVIKPEQWLIDLIMNDELKAEKRRAKKIKFEPSITEEVKKWEEA